MKAILIARVSTEEQKEAGNSLPAQTARLERYCQNKGFSILKSFSFDESAYKQQREDFDAILDFVLEQKEKVAVCLDKVDRLTRNMFDKRVGLLYEKALTDEIELHFVSDGQIITSRISATEKFRFGMGVGLAKYFSDSISDNVKRAIEQKIRKGEWPGRAPYGYKNIACANGTKEIVIDDYAASVVLKVYEWYATGAYSMITLCQKIKSEFGLDWATGFLDKVLKNTFYYGLMKLKGVLHSHRYPPIITKALFEQVQQVKAGFKKKKFKYAGKPYIYRGLISCATCGLSITPEKKKGHIYYHCTQYNGKHGAKYLREEAITEQLADTFKRLQMPPEVLEQISATLTEVHQNKIDFQNKQLDELTRKHKELSKMMDNLYLDKLRGRISEADYDRHVQSFQSQKDDIVERLARLQEAENSYYITAKYLLELSNRAYDLFMGSEVEEKRLLIKLVLSNLRLDGENIVWIANKPFDAIINCSDEQRWRPLVDEFSNGEIIFNVTLQGLQTVFDELNMRPILS